jgi:hypothetical protein
MVDVYSCRGEFSLWASDDYLAMGAASAIDLEQQNYGGHYVVAAESIEG